MFGKLLEMVTGSVVSYSRTDASEGGNLSYKINRTIIVNGEKKWVHANSEQEYAEKLRKLFTEPANKERHGFRQYAENWFAVYSVPNIEKATQACYRSLLKKHIYPVFGEIDLEDITTEMLQKLFNGMTGAKTTKDKVRAVLNMILETAVDEDLISKNPLRSKRIRLTGERSKVTPPYSVEQMKFLVKNLGGIQRLSDRNYLAVQALHPLRLEEVLGLQWRDLDFQNHILFIRRAVTHPDRNKPIIKATKTVSSVRQVGLSAIAEKYLEPGEPEQFVVGGEKPLSYQQVVRMCERIRRDTGFEEKVTPKRFRTTVLTDIYDRTKDIKATQAAAGHTTSEMTLEHYVKGRGSFVSTASAVDAIYGEA